MYASAYILLGEVKTQLEWADANLRKKSDEVCEWKTDCYDY